MSSESHNNRSRFGTGIFAHAVRSAYVTSATSQGRNTVYTGPIDPYFLEVILIPEPHFLWQNFGP